MAADNDETPNAAAVKLNIKVKDSNSNQVHTFKVGLPRPHPVYASFDSSHAVPEEPSFADWDHDFMAVSLIMIQVKMSTKMGKVIDAYCQKLGISRTQVRFLLDGERVTDEHTPQSLNMQDEDQLDCVYETTGGFE